MSSSGGSASGRSFPVHHRSAFRVSTEAVGDRARSRERRPRSKRDDVGAFVAGGLRCVAAFDARVSRVGLLWLGRDPPRVEERPPYQDVAL